MGEPKAEAFLQWKGTNACYDFWCTCGRALHFDGYFGRDFTCGGCGAAWQLPHMLQARPQSEQRPMPRLLYDVPVIATERGAEFRVAWPGDSPVPARGQIAHVVDDDDGCQRQVYADVMGDGQAPDGGTFLRLRTRDPADGPCSFRLTRRERAYLIDAVMVLMHQMEQAPQNDLSELPELQALLDRLMELPRR